MTNAPSAPESDSSSAGDRRHRYVPVVGQRLKRILFVVLGLFALMAVNSVYLVGVTILEWSTGGTYQNWFYLNTFIVHLVLGLLLVVPVIVFGVAHIRNAYKRPNRRAVYVGYALFVVALVLLASGIVLTRLEGIIVVKDPAVRAVAYWTHVCGRALLLPVPGPHCHRRLHPGAGVAGRSVLPEMP
jgi:hypothetical protein